MKHQLVHRVAFVLQRCGDGQALAMLEEAEDHPASRRRAIGIDQAKFPPGMNGSAGSGGAAQRSGLITNPCLRGALHDTNLRI